MKRCSPIWVFMICLAVGASSPAEAQKFVRSSIKYTQGTEALTRGDYQEAADLLAEAIQLDPELSRNHTNYSAALFELGRYSEGWPHARKAVLLDRKNQEAQNNSRRYIKRLLNDAGLNTGASLEEIVAVLGEPDSIGSRNECIWYQYGISALCFKNEVFFSIGDMQWRPRR